MLSFKQFLTENPLEDLHLELWLQRKFGLTKDERRVARLWVDGEEMIEDHQELWQKIYDHYCHSMPYDVAKADAEDITPEYWCYETVLHDLKDEGVETHFKPDGKYRPRGPDDYPPRRHHDDYSQGDY